MSRFRGKVALVTGASAGIGGAVARVLADDGMRLVVCARREDRLRELAATLPGETLVVPCDVRDEEQIAKVFGAARERFGGVDVLVNNAGLGRNAPLTSGSTADWREMLDVNVLALAVFTREAVSDMRRRGDDGHVIHISSMAAHRVPPGSGMYAATKYGVRALTEALRMELRELGSRIRVTAVSPGFVETEFAEVYHRDPSARERTYGKFKVLDAEDVASMVRYVLAAPAHMAVHDILVRPTDQKS